MLLCYSENFSRPGQGPVPGLGQEPGPVPVPVPMIGSSPGNTWSRGLVPVPVLVIYGLDVWSQSWSRLYFGPGTSPGHDPGPVAWLLNYS